MTFAVPVQSTGNESVPKIIINSTMNLYFKLQSAFCRCQTITVSECCLTELLPYILFEKYINILSLEIPAQGTSTVPIVSAHFRSTMALLQIDPRDAPHQAYRAPDKKVDDQCDKLAIDRRKYFVALCV